MYHEYLEQINTVEEFKKRINYARKANKNKWYTFTGIINGKSIVIKAFGTWMQVCTISGVDNSNPMEQKVKAFNLHLESLYEVIMR